MLLGVCSKPGEAKRLKPPVMELTVFNVGSCGVHWEQLCCLANELSTCAAESDLDSSLH